MFGKPVSTACAAAAAASVWLLTAQAAAAADFVWLASPASASWNEADENWTGAGSVWVSASTNSAVFGVSDTQAVTADPLTLSNLTFEADGYTVGGGRLTMYGIPSVTAGVSAVVSATITNIGVWAKVGTGTLTLDPGEGNTNVFYALKAATGTVQIVSGTNFVTQMGSNPESGPLLWVTGGKLTVGGGIVKTTGNNYARVSEYGTLLITNGIVDLTSVSELLNGHNSPGVVTVSDAGLLDVKVIRVSQNTLASNLTVINVNTGGVIKLNNFGLDVSSARNGTVNFNGGTIVAKGGAFDMLGGTTNSWRNILVNVLGGGAIVDSAGFGISIRQNMKGSAGDGGLAKLGGGILYLRGTNTYTGATLIKGGGLNIIRDHNLGAVPAEPATNLLVLASATLQSSDNHELAASRTIWVTNSATATFDSQAYTQMIYGTIMCADTSATVAKAGSGVVVIDPGAAAVNQFGSLQTAAGTLVIASGTNLVTRYCNVQNGPGLRVYGGTLLVAGGVLMTTTGQYINVDGGHLLVTNGLVNVLSCDQILNAIGSSAGYTTVKGSGEIWANQVRVSQNGGNPSNNVINVSTGGVLRLTNFYIDINASQKGMLVMSGGTVAARRTETNFLGRTATFLGTNEDRWLTNIWAVVREGGAIFDTLGYSVGVKNPLLSGAPADGGLTKRGSGRLVLFNTNTFNGATSVQEGTLELARDDALPAENTVNVFTNAVLDAGGKTQTLASLGGSGTVINPGGLSVTTTVAPGDEGSFGTLTLAAAPAALGGTLSVGVSTNGACDRLHVEGDLNVSSLSLSVEDTAQLAKFKRYVVATCAGTLTPPFASVSPLPPRWLLKYDTAGKQAYLVYDFGTLILVR